MYPQGGTPSRQADLGSNIGLNVSSIGRGAPPRMSTPTRFAGQGLNQIINTSRKPSDHSLYNVAPYVPKLPLFSGDDPPQKGECLYYEWRFEVRCLLNDPEVTEHGVLIGIRRSLRGTARQVMIPLGECASVSDILGKLDAMFSDVSTKGMIMQEFFNAQQQPNESVTSFGCRLETLLQTAINNGHLSIDAKNDLLRHKFWASLYSDSLKAQTRHKYDSVPDYNTLLMEIRQVEKELSLSHSVMPSTKPKARTCAVAAENSFDSRLNDLEQSLKNEIVQVESRLQTKYESKLDSILDRLDRMSTADGGSFNGPSADYSQSQSSYRGRGRGQRGQGYARGRGFNSYQQQPNA